MSWGETSIGEVRTLALGLADALDCAGCHDAAGDLRASAGEAGDDSEGLLALRSAIISTRPTWAATVPRALQAEALRVLALAKRLAIEM